MVSNLPIAFMTARHWAETPGLRCSRLPAVRPSVSIARASLCIAMRLLTVRRSGALSNRKRGSSRMAERALIIAVEEYPQITDGSVEKKLSGTLVAAQNFRDWLTAKWHAENTSGQILFCSNPLVPGGQGASKDDIIRALRLLLKDGRDQTEVFYFYFSGHGFRLPKERAKLTDVLVAAEFEDVIQSGASCFKLDALIAGLRSSLGIGCHYYFVDACRNEVKKAIGSVIMP